MIIPFIWGAIIGILSGAAAVFYWAYREGKKKNNQEVNEVPEPTAEQKSLDITPELAAGAHNIIRQYCSQREECNGCPFTDACDDCFSSSPVCWPELKIENEEMRKRE